MKNLHASVFSDITKSRELLRHQLQLITSSQSSFFPSGRELNYLPLESAGLDGVRRVEPLEIIKSPTPLTKQERGRVYRRKRSAHRDPPAVEPQPFNQPSFGFTDCELFTSLSATTSSSPTFFPKNIGVTHCRNNFSSSDKMGVICLNSPSISCSLHRPPKAPLPSFTSIPKSYTYDTVVPSIHSTTPIHCSGPFRILHNSFEMVLILIPILILIVILILILRTLYFALTKRF